MAADRHASSACLGKGPQNVYRFDINWAAVEHDYRESSFSLRDLACKHGCSHSAIANRADRMGWTRVGGTKPVTKTGSAPGLGPQKQRWL